jgi:7,8-dihydro-6-hydroxymethylpterin-pyrophosphokinase
MKETAVEWLEDQIKNSKYYFKLMAEINSRSTVAQSNIFEQAKEMEKERKEDFFNAGVRYGSGSVMATEWGEDTEEYNFEQYYNETFKSE